MSFHRLATHPLSPFTGPAYTAVIAPFKGDIPQKQEMSH